MTQAEAAIRWCELMIRQQSCTRRVVEGEKHMESCQDPALWQRIRADVTSARRELVESFRLEEEARTSYLNACIQEVPSAAPDR